MSAVPGDSRVDRAAWLRVRERGSERLLRAYAALSVRVGRRASRWLLWPITAYYLAFAPAARGESRRYLRLALGREPRLADIWRHFHCFATSIHDRVFLARGDFQGFDVQVQGVEHLATANGALLMGAHVGSFEIINAVGRIRAGAAVAMAMYEQNARKMRAMIDALKPPVPPLIIALGRVDAMLQIREQLDAGTFVGMLADRTLGAEPTQTVCILGRPADLPVGPMRAAALLRRRVLFMSGVNLGDGRYRVTIAPLADFTDAAAGTREEAIRAGIEAFADRLTALCRDTPYNWFNFFPFWRN